MINNAAKFYGKGDKKYFCILSDFLSGYKPTKEEIERKNKLLLNDFFELFDDDDIKYYSGYANFDLMNENDLDEFTILNMATNDSGCTYIKTRCKKSGKMVMV